MATATTKKEGGHGGQRHGPPTDEERRQHKSEYKHDLLNEYRKRYGNAPITADQTWQLYRTTQERWHTKMTERFPPPASMGGAAAHHGVPAHLEERRKKIRAEVQKDFQKDFAANHGTNKVTASQAWALIDKVQRNKQTKWEADQQKHGGHGHGGHGQGHH